MTSGSGVRAVALTTAAIVSGVVLFIAGINVLPVGSTGIVQWGTFAWPVAGPHLVLASLVATGLAVVLVRKRRHPFGIVIAALAVLALLSSTWITSSIVLAAKDAGGSANPFTALVPSAAKPAAADFVETYKVADGEELRAHVYRPGGDSLAPVMMYIHGGGWVTGSPAIPASLTRWYAQQGWLVVSVGYRLATAERATWDKAPADVACALTWTVAHASKWGGDPRRLIVAGDSAGGNLAVNLAWSAAIGKAPMECATPGPVPVPAAAAAAYPVVNPAYSWEHGRTFLGFAPREFTRRYLGGTPQQYPDRLAAISSLTFASASAPPTLIVEPERDDFIPAQGVYEVAREARQKGVNLTLERIPFVHHGFDLVRGTLGDQANRSTVANYLRGLGLGP